jgi:hypothetical protein
VARVLTTTVKAWHWQHKREGPTACASSAKRVLHRSSSEDWLRAASVWAAFRRAAVLRVKPHLDERRVGQQRSQARGC